jgi:hypothetical protein
MPTAYRLLSTLRTKFSRLMPSPGSRRWRSSAAPSPRSRCRTPCRFGLALLDVLKSILWNFLAGVDGRAGEGRIEGRLARQLVAVAHQLQVQLRRHRRAAGVHHFVLHVHVIDAALERVGLDQLHAALHRRLELHHQLVGAVLQRAVAAAARPSPSCGSGSRRPPGRSAPGRCARRSGPSARRAAALSPRIFGNSVFTTVPPSVSKVTRSTSVLTVKRSRGTAGRRRWAAPRPAWREPA